MNSVDERKQMTAAGFEWDPAQGLARDYVRWSHFRKGVTALRQPYMSDEQWEQHKVEKIAEATK